MDYKIVVDSCCEIPADLKDDGRFEVVPLSLMVGDCEIVDDESFDQADFLRRVAESPECPHSACPSPAAYMEAYRTEADRVYVVTFSSKLSGSYNAAVLGAEMYKETYGEKDIYVVDSETASGGESQIMLKLMEYEAAGMTFAQITEKISVFRNKIHTYFVLDNLDAMIKNGRIRGIKAMVATTLNVKPILAGLKGSIIQKGQAIGMKKTLAKMVETIVAEVGELENKRIIITHCNALKRAEKVRDMLREKYKTCEYIIMDMRGVSSLYASDGGIIVTM